MAKICFYCGKELQNGERCSCAASGTRAPGSQNTSKAEASSAHDRKQRKASEKARKERIRNARRKEAGPTGTSRTGSHRSVTSGFFRRLTVMLVSGAGFNPQDSFLVRVVYSLIQSLLRPVAASDHFYRTQDHKLSVFFLVLFAASFGVFNLHFDGVSPVAFLQGFALGIGLAALLNGILLGVFRFIARTRYSFAGLLTAFCVPSVYFSIFLLLAFAGRASSFSMIATLMTGAVAGGILHFLSLKSLTGKSDDRLALHVVFSYWIFFSFTGFILTALSAPVLTGS